MKFTRKKVFELGAIFAVSIACLCGSVLMFDEFVRVKNKTFLRDGVVVSKNVETGMLSNSVYYTVLAEDSNGMFKNNVPFDDYKTIKNGDKLTFYVGRDAHLTNWLGIPFGVGLLLIALAGFYDIYNAFVEKRNQDINN
jgi:hypothetical protein